MTGQIVISGMTAACLMSPPCWADDADIALDFFHETCLAAESDFVRVSETASRESWEATATIAALVPVPSWEVSKSWTADVTGLGAKVLIGAASATLGGQAIDSCTIAFFDGQFASFEERFLVRTDAEKFGEESDGLQVSRVYVLIAGGRRQLVKVTAPVSPSARHMVMASSIASRTRH
ncbi:hypothetical protein [Aminobacter ciceronei]|uniref:Uncharacterized protein n=1 Tax=Aminobacter ciceronei TaxID=150723 RepID=A0ABR6C5F3_9HYPH|nr:hypothetical protein [Aminobacter ciceronei]MBA8906066.1 hypothetical protein [Aminobacter ciceronei]MBA9019845.1 hypothetical protein [Aminobacter ciceronei]